MPDAPGGKKKWYRHRWPWIVLAILVLLIIIGNLTSNPKNTRASVATTTTAAAKTIAKPKQASPATTRPTPTTTRATVAPTTRATIPPPTRETVPPTTSPPTTAALPPTTVAATECYIDPEGNCYRAGEYCPDTLHGQTVQGEDGPIICENNDGWRWEDT
jgi:hypothetical protein